MYKDIEKMLEDGMTPEKLYQEALRIVEAKNAAAAKLNKEKINTSRGELITALANYIELITNKKLDKNDLKEVEEGFIRIEKAATATDNTRERVKRKSTKPTDEEKLIEFMKMIGAMM